MSTENPNPLYNESGDMVCRVCGESMVGSETRQGDYYLCCNNLGCHNYGVAFIAGSMQSNPSRTR